MRRNSTRIPGSPALGMRKRRDAGPAATRHQGWALRSAPIGRHRYSPLVESFADGVDEALDLLGRDAQVALPSPPVPLLSAKNFRR